MLDTSAESCGGLVGCARTVVSKDLVDLVLAVAGDAADQVGRRTGVEVERNAGVPQRAHCQPLGRKCEQIAWQDSDIVACWEEWVLGDQAIMQGVEGIGIVRWAAEPWRVRRASLVRPPSAMGSRSERRSSLGWAQACRY